jgi:hypothetical protein
MKTRIRLSDLPHRPAAASISHRSSLFAPLRTWLWSKKETRISALGKTGRGSHLRLVRRNGHPVPAPVRAVIKTRTSRMGYIAVATLLIVSLMVAGIYGGMHLARHTPAAYSSKTK